MNEYEISNYGIFSDAVTSTKSYQEKIDTIQETVNEVNQTLSDTSIFMGAVQENCVQELSSITNDITSITTNFTTIFTYLTDTSSAYQKGDATASATVLNLSGNSSNPLITTSSSSSSVSIPDSVRQSGYTVTCYGEGGWYLGGGSTPTAVASGTNQKSVHEAWLADGARYKNGIAVLNVDGTDHYLIATAPTFGDVGDSVNVNLKNGQTISCVIADSKSTHDSNYTSYGHSNSDGSVNVLEFEVDRNKYNQSGNPTTSTWNLDWDSSSSVANIENQGTII